MIRIFAAGVLALAVPLSAFATAVVQSVQGDVQAAGAPVFAGQKVLAPSTFTTGAGAQAVLKFEDGMQIVRFRSPRLLRLRRRSAPPIEEITSSTPT